MEEDNSVWHDSKMAEDQPNIAMWEANPQSPADDTPIQASVPVRSTFVFTARKRESSCFSALLMMSVVFGMVMISLSRSSLQSVDKGVSELLRSRELSDKMQGFEKDIRRLHRELSALDMMLQDPKISPTANKSSNDAPHSGDENQMEELNTLQSKVKVLSNNAETLKSEVQAVSRKEALQKYGYGTHRVEIQLAFPDGQEGPNTFVIELAPMDLMPHSVHFFLDMVSSGLLDGCSFILNALHVLKAAPLPFDGSSAAEKARSFTRHGVESVAFKEYSEEYPHKRYTVGFAADGSPSFYINTEDNSEIHVGDPCFGRIIAGFDAVRRLEQSPTRNGIWFEQRIGIKHAVLLSAVGTQSG